MYTHTHTQTHTFLIHSFVNRHFGSLYILAMANDAVMLIGVQTFPSKYRFCFISYLARIVFDRLCACSFFNLLRNLHIVFHNSRAIYIPTISAQGFPVLYCACMRACVCVCMFWDRKGEDNRVASTGLATGKPHTASQGRASGLQITVVFLPSDSWKNLSLHHRTLSPVKLCPQTHT